LIRDLSSLEGKANKEKKGKNGRHIGRAGFSRRITNASTGKKGPSKQGGKRVERDQDGREKKERHHQIFKRPNVRIRKGDSYKKMGKERE